MKNNVLLLFIALLSGAAPLSAQDRIVPGDHASVLVEEFVYTDSSFPSCHAATIVETDKGEIMIALFGGLHESNADCSIWTSHLRDGRWTDPVLVADGMVDGVKTACWNPVLFQVPGGELLLFYKVGRFVQDWSGYLIRSRDGGDTWSRPELLPEGILGPIKNKPLLIGGELICGSSLERGGWRVYVEVTDPGVTSWEKYGPVNNRKSKVQIIQPALFDEGGGRLRMLCRSIDLRGNIETLVSEDGGRRWSAPVSSGLPNNDSGLDGVRLDDGTYYIVYNHRKSSVDGPASRSPINIAVSDNGTDWYAGMILERRKGDEYSYPSVITGSDGMLHIVYTWNRKFIKYVKVDPRMFSLDRDGLIVDEQWPVNIK